MKSLTWFNKQTLMVLFFAYFLLTSSRKKIITRHWKKISISTYSNIKLLHSHITFTYSHITHIIHIFTYNIHFIAFTLQITQIYDIFNSHPHILSFKHTKQHLTSSEAILRIKEHIKSKRLISLNHPYLGKQYFLVKENANIQSFSQPMTSL